MHHAQSQSDPSVEAGREAAGERPAAAVNSSAMCCAFSVAAKLRKAQIEGGSATA